MLGDVGGVGHRLVPVELRRLESGGVDGAHHPLGGLVPEHADGEHLGREPGGDVAGHDRRDLPAGRGEHEAHGIGSHGHGHERVLLAGDAADLDEHCEETTGGWCRPLYRFDRPPAARPPLPRDRRW